MSLRHFLPAYLFVYFAAAFFWRSFIVWKRTGINPVTFKHADNAHDFIGRVFKIVFGLVVLVVSVYAFWPSGYQYLAPLTWLEHRWVVVIGIGLLVLSFVWTVLAQVQMGESWRIGIDEQHQTPLVTRGVFGWSRNPIFVGMKITLLGLFLIIPNAFTLLALALGVVLIHIQVRLEEEFLHQSHGEAYERYRRHVRRWM